MKNKRAIFILMLVVMLGVTGFVWATDSNGLGFIRDMIIEKDTNSTAITAVDTSKKELVGNYVITPIETIDDDGSLIFTVTDNKTEKSVGRFSFKPWVSKNLLFTALPDGNILLGDGFLLNSTADRIEPLGGSNITVFDYSIWKDSLAYLGKNNNEDKISLYVKDLKTGQTNIIDSYKYPENQYPEKILLGWGSDGYIYYDSCEGAQPVIKTLDYKNGQTKIFMKAAMNPQLSPDGSKIVLLFSDVFNAASQTASELALVDTKTGSKITSINGSDRIFWAKNYLLNKDIDKSLLNVYDLSTGGKKVKEVPLNDVPYQLTSNNDQTTLKCYHFDKNTVTTTEMQINP